MKFLNNKPYTLGLQQRMLAVIRIISSLILSLKEFIDSASGLSSVGERSLGMTLT
jgi:hypothetical protein